MLGKKYLNLILQQIKSLKNKKTDDVFVLLKLAH